MFREHVLPFLAWLFYRAWTATWRLKVVEPASLKQALASARPVVFAMWHGDELTMLNLWSFYKVATMTSTSKDGELMTKILSRFDILSSRGSSTRGAISGLKGLIRMARAGRIPLVAVDGPKGPFHKAKPGIFELSRLLQAPIFPAGVAASRHLQFKKAWNKATLPLPFSKVAVVWEEPLPPVTGGDDSRSTNLALGLEKALDSAGRKASILIAGSPHQC